MMAPSLQLMMFILWWLAYVYYSNMSKCESQLRHFLKTLSTQQSFPKQSLLNFTAATPFNTPEFLKIHAESWDCYTANIRNYRELVMLIYMGLSRNMKEIIQRAIDLVEGMILSRFLMLIFNQELQFEGDRVLLYLEPTLELTVVKAMQNGKEQDMLSMLERVNSKQHKFNQIGFLLEITFIKKIQKYLQESSLHQFNQHLKTIMHAKKYSRLFLNQNSLQFRLLAILRQEEDKQQTYYLQFINGKLVKLKSSFTMNSLPNWVQQAFWKVPRSLNLEQFRSISVAKVHSFLSEVQVFASSPLIQQFDCYTQDEIFLTIFQQYLMGLNISREPYKFHWEKMRSSLQLMRKSSEDQNPCYRLVMAEQLMISLGKEREELNYMDK